MELVPTTYAYARQIPKDKRINLTIEQLVQAVYKDEDALAEWSPTLIEGDKIMAVIGLRPHWPGVAEAWTFLSDEVREKPLELTKSVKASLLEAAERLDLTRIQAVADASDRRAGRWLHLLGFHCEGLMRNYGLNGEGDFFMYARIF